jgi:hypothetical protein
MAKIRAIHFQITGSTVIQHHKYSLSENKNAGLKKSTLSFISSSCACSYEDASYACA